MPIEQNVQKSDAGQLVELFTLSFVPLGIPYFIRWSPSINLVSGSNIVYGGESFQPAAIESSGFEWSTSSAFPTPTLSVSNVFNAFSLLNTTYNDMLGAEVERILTFEEYLDTGSEANASSPELLMVDRYRVDRKVLQNKQVVEYELSSSLDQEGRVAPTRQFTRDICDHVYRRYNPNTVGGFDYDGVTCPYAGEISYDIFGEVTSASGDVCSKHYSTGCTKRFTFPFGTQGLPFRAFPAMNDIPR